MPKKKFSKVSKDDVLAWGICVVVIIIVIGFCAWFCIQVERDKTEGVKVTTTEVEPWQFKLLSGYVEMRNATNQFGGVIRTDKYFHYSFVDYQGNVKFGERQMYDTYYVNYSLEFKVGEENKFLQYNYPSRTVYVFIMTPEMHSQVFQTQ